MTAATVKRRLVFAVLALTLVASTVVLMADQAGAHKATLTVTVTCQVDGQWTANWSIANSEAAKVMDISGEDVTAFASPVGFSGTATDSTVHVNSVASVTAHVTVDWVQHEPLSYSLTAFRPEGCVVPPPPPPPPPPVTPDPPPVLIPPMVLERSEAAVPVVSATLPYTG